MEISRRAFLRGKVPLDPMTAASFGADRSGHQESKPQLIELHISEECFAYQHISCRSCQDVCQSQAISFRLQIGKPAFPEVEQEQCDQCGECFGICPADAISLKTKPHSVEQPADPRGAK